MKKIIQADVLESDLVFISVEQLEMGLSEKAW